MPFWVAASCSFCGSIVNISMASSSSSSPRISVRKPSPSSAISPICCPISYEEKKRLIDVALQHNTGCRRGLVSDPLKTKLCFAKECRTGDFHLPPKARRTPHSTPSLTQFEGPPPTDPQCPKKPASSGPHSKMSMVPQWILQDI